MVELALLVASALLAVVPLTSVLAAVWWLDRYDREPVWLLALTFLWGAVGAVPVAVALVTLLTGSTGLPTSGWTEGALGLVITAPVVEEPAKALVLLAIVTSRHFDDMTDGFVYGAAAGLGFAMVENLLYFRGSVGDPAAWAGTVLVRTFFSANMHATATAIAGAALGWARFRAPLTRLGAAALGLGVAIGVHALWNGLIAAEELLDAGGTLLGLDLLLLPLEILVAGVVFELCVRQEAATIRSELAEEAQRGVLPPEHPAVLASWLGRLRGGWLPDHVDREAYVRVATRLAVRKRQARQLGPRATWRHVDEIDRLRGAVTALLRAPATRARASTST